MSDATVRGADDLERLARRLKETGNGDLKKELLRGIRNAAKPIIPKLRESAREKLPKRGGLAADIAGSKFAVRTRATGTNTGVRIGASGRGSLRSLNAGRLRHPVFGHDVYVEQRVESGFFTEPLEASAPKVRASLQDVMGDIARRIERGI